MIHLRISCLAARQLNNILFLLHCIVCTNSEIAIGICPKFCKQDWKYFCSGYHLCYSIVCGQKPTRIYCLGEVPHEKMDVSPYISWRGYCLKRM
jgi:hypothetical protein